MTYYANFDYLTYLYKYCLLPLIIKNKINILYQIIINTYTKLVIKISLFLAIFCSLAAAQGDDELILGKTNKLTSGAVYDLSDPYGPNIEVNLWGFVRYPGRYRVPLNTTFMDLMSFAGGPVENSKLEEIRIVRFNDTLSKKPTEIIKLNYEDLLWADKLKTNKSLVNPTLKSRDLVVVMEEKRYTFRDNLAFFLPIITSVISVATFIVTITRN